MREKPHTPNQQRLNEISRILQDHPHIPKNAKLEIFLWDDPLFADGPVSPEDLTDPEMIALRREARLLALENLYIEKGNLQETVEWMREAIAREVWTWQQLLPCVPFEVAEKIQIERRVNMMDPDFSFQKAVFSKNASDDQHAS